MNVTLLKRGKEDNLMVTSDLIIVGVISAIIIVCSIILIIKLFIKPSLQKMRVSTFFGLKSAKVKFKVFDSFLSHSLFVSPRKEYEVVYKLETDEGKINIKLDGQLDISTTSKKEGSEMITFSRFKPLVRFQGDNAKNGECSIKVYKKR